MAAPGGFLRCAQQHTIPSHPPQHRRWPPPARAVLAVLGLLVPALAAAAGTLLEGLDAGRCQRWQLSDDRDSAVFTAGSAHGQVLAQTAAQLQAQGLRTVVLGGQIIQHRAVRPGAASAPPVGVGAGATGSVACVAAAPMHIRPHGRFQSTLACVSALDDPPRAWAYQANKQDSAFWRPASHTCVADCRSYPVPAVHELPWEDGPVNLAHQRASRRFFRQCRP